MCCCAHTHTHTLIVVSTLLPLYLDVEVHDYVVLAKEAKNETKITEKNKAHYNVYATTAASRRPTRKQKQEQKPKTERANHLLITFHLYVRASFYTCIQSDYFLLLARIIFSSSLIFFPLFAAIIFGGTNNSIFFIIWNFHLLFCLLFFSSSPFFFIFFSCVFFFTS